MSKKAKSEKKHAVEICPELYGEISKLAKANPKKYHSEKAIVEEAVRNYIRLIKYDIENLSLLVSNDGRFAAPSTKNFTPCIICDRVFLADKRKEDERRICGKCGKVLDAARKMGVY